MKPVSLMMVQLANLMGEIRQASVGSVAVNVIGHSGTSPVIGAPLVANSRRRPRESVGTPCLLGAIF